MRLISKMMAVGFSFARLGMSKIMFLSVVSALLIGSLSVPSYAAPAVTSGNTVDVKVTNYTHSAMSAAKNGQWSKQWGDDALYVNTSDLAYGQHNVEVVTLGGGSFNDSTSYSASYDVFRDGNYQGTCNMKFATYPGDINGSQITIGCSSAKNDGLPTISYKIDPNTFGGGGTITFTVAG